MSLVILFLLCTGFSFVGTIPFGMVNMAVADVSIRKGLQAGILFSLGAAIVEFGQGMITVKFSNLFNENENVLLVFQWIAVVIFIGFGIYFFLKKSVQPQIVEKKYRYNKGWIWKGMGISALNVMPYPFWIFFSTFLIANDLMEKSMNHYIILSLGMMVGAFIAFVLYAKFSLWLVNKNSKIEPIMRKIFATIFLLLGVIQFCRIMYATS